MVGRAGGRSGLVLACDHAGNALPRRLGDLGLAGDDLEDHIAVDIGIFSTCSWLAHHLDAPLIGQFYSRLVIDCNRRPGTPSSIPLRSDGRDVPGNRNLSEPERQSRVEEIFEPYQRHLADLLADRRRFLGRAPVLCAMHSFTRIYGGVRRDCDIGVIHGADSRHADRVLAGLKGVDGLRVGRNVPYSIDFAGDQTIPAHGESGGVPYIEIEICQDLIATCRGQRRIAGLLARAFRSIDAASPAFDEVSS